MKINYHTLVIGQTRSGKTFDAIKLMQSQEFTDGLKLYINTKLENKFYPNFRSVVEDMDLFHSILTDHYRHPKNRFVYCFNPYNKSLVDDLIDELFEMKRAGTLKGRVYVGIDELHQYKGKRFEPLRKLFTMGLGFDLFAVGISQRIQHVNNDARENSDIFIIKYSKDVQMEFLEQRGYITVPDQYKTPDGQGGYYMYRYELWNTTKEKIDHTTYLQEPSTPLQKLKEK